MGVDGEPGAERTELQEGAPTRADARRNRTRILEAAGQAFADEGLGVPVDEIARRAGVGPGTLYRNFPTKEALFEAVILGHLESLAQEARELATSEHPAASLYGFIGRLVEEASKKRNLVEALTAAGGPAKERLVHAKEEVGAAIAVLLERAQAAGEIRADVTVEDLFGMVLGCAMYGDDADPSSQSRMVSVVCDGLRQGAATRAT